MWQYNNSNELYHYGVLGMRWGRRKSRRSSEDSMRVQKLRKKKAREMTNQELSDVNKRMQLEKSYRELSDSASITKNAIKAVTATATTIASIAAAYGTYKKVAEFAVEKIGKKAV